MKLILNIYLLFAVHTIIHELFHVICANIFKINIKKIQLGYETLNILQIGKIHLSVLLLGGYVEVKETELMEHSNMNLIIYFLSGCIGNFILVLILSIFLKGILVYFNRLIFLLIVITNLIPFGTNDMALLLHFLRLKTYNSKRA